jgi:serine/threonine protein kinase
VQLPRTIAGYEFVQLLGVGGFGAVYRAQVRGALGFEQEVAIKVLDADRARMNPDLVKSLALEAKILSAVQHPNVVQARHFLQISDEALGDTWMLVMELVRGQTLRRLLTAQSQAPRPLPISAPLQVLSELADGLHFAHRLTDATGAAVGLVHRDLKPENVVVSNEGRVKILDFGIAYAKRRADATAPSGLIVGTPHYMSPEQLRGEAVDRRSDLYSLGTIGYEMFAGESYVTHRTLAMEAVVAARDVRFEQREQRLHDALVERYPGEVHEALREELVGLLRDLLHQDRAMRPGLAGDVFDRIEAMSAHRPSVGRGFVRRSVEALNDADRLKPPPDLNAALAIPATQPLQRAPAPAAADPTEQPTVVPVITQELPPPAVDPAPAPEADRWRSIALVLAALLGAALAVLAVR